MVLCVCVCVCARVCVCGLLCSAAMTISGKLHNISYYLRAYYTSPTCRWNVLRYPITSVFIFYWSLRTLRRTWGTKGYRGNDEGPIHNDPRSFEELCHKVLIPKGLLLSVEGQTLAKYKGDKHKMLFSWCLIALGKIMHTSCPQGELNNPYLATLPEQTELMKNVKDEIIGLRGAMGMRYHAKRALSPAKVTRDLLTHACHTGAINNSLMFPIPFTYYHIVNTTVMTYLTILSWCFLYMTPGSQVFVLLALNNRRK